MKLSKIVYAELNAKQKEIFNFQTVAGLLAQYGFNCIKLSDDWQGADFLAYHKDGLDTLKVQLKGRPLIAKKYHGKGLHITFPLFGIWHILEHDVLLQLADDHTGWLRTSSWLEGGEYHTDKPPAALVESLVPYRL